MEKYPELAKEFQNNLYIDDLMMGSASVCETKEKKMIATEVFEDASFRIHKWHSNQSTLEVCEGESVDEDGEETYAKQQLGGTNNL
jgi:hypothetical protein